LGRDNGQIEKETPNTSQEISIIGEIPRRIICISSDIDDTSLFERDIQVYLKYKYRLEFIRLAKEQKDNIRDVIVRAHYFIGIYQENFVNAPLTEYIIAQNEKARSRILVFAHNAIYKTVVSNLQEPYPGSTSAYTTLSDVPRIVARLVSN
jgi:hypothetical protein